MRVEMYFSVSPNAPTSMYLHQAGHQHVNKQADDSIQKSNSNAFLAGPVLFRQRFGTDTQWKARLAPAKCSYRLGPARSRRYLCYSLFGLTDVVSPGSPMWKALNFPQLSQSKVDKIVPRTQHANLRIVGHVDPSFRALSGRLKFTVRRHKFNKDSLSRARGLTRSGRRGRRHRSPLAPGRSDLQGESSSVFCHVQNTEKFEFPPLHRVA